MRCARKCDSAESLELVIFDVPRLENCRSESDGLCKQASGNFAQLASEPHASRLDVIYFCK